MDKTHLKHSKIHTYHQASISFPSSFLAATLHSPSCFPLFYIQCCISIKQMKPWGGRIHLFLFSSALFPSSSMFLLLEFVSLYSNHSCTALSMILSVHFISLWNFISFLDFHICQEYVDGKGYMVPSFSSPFCLHNTIPPEPKFVSAIIQAIPLNWCCVPYLFCVLVKE